MFFISHGGEDAPGVSQNKLSLQRDSSLFLIEIGESRALPTIARISGCIFRCRYTFIEGKGYAVLRAYTQ